MVLLRGTKNLTETSFRMLDKPRRFRTLEYPASKNDFTRYPQLYSRGGLVHEFRPLSTSEIRRLLDENWMQLGVSLPLLDYEANAVGIRTTGGNFRLLHRLLAQVERIAQISKLSIITRQGVEAAHESSVIGQLLQLGLQNWQTHYAK